MQPGFDPADPLVSWWSVGDVPIVEMRPGDVPVAVETSIGTIEWALVEEQPALSWLTTRGNEVWVASGVAGSEPVWPPSIHVTDDNGSNWREVAVDPAPPGVERGHSAPGR